MHKTAIEILDTVEVGALATVNRDRTPLVTPVHFARYKEDFIIWVSDIDTRHSVNVYRNGRIDFAVWNGDKRAVYINSSATELPEAERQAALEAYSKKLGNFMPGGEKSQIYIAPIGEIDEKTTTKNWLHYIAKNATYSVQ